VKRITVDEVKAAYAKTGLTPIRKRFLSPDCQCGCPLSALYFSEHPGPVGGPLAVESWANQTFGHSYTGGFVSGCDGGSYSATGDYFVGMQDGRAVAIALGLNG
jgi:hypothetical protein